MQILPNGLCQFIDSSGAPLASGTVGFYAPGTLNPLTTFQDQAGTIPNTNPVPLNSRGQALIWGSGIYRQILKDASGVTIWDALTQSADAAFSGSTGASLIGFDGTNLAVQLQTRVNRVVDSIAGLRALSKATYTRAWVTGYYGAHDGGGGAYQYDPADTTTADNGGTIIVAADGGRWKLQKIGAISVKQFGAKGDGATDDTASINLALAGMGMGTLYFPAGTYMTAGPHALAVGQYILGAGQFATLISTTSLTNDCFTMAGPYCGVKDIAITGLTTRTGGRFIATTVPQGGPNLIENIEFSNYFIGIQINSTRVFVRNITAINAVNASSMVINIASGGDIFIDSVSADTAIFPAYGLLIQSGGGIAVSNCDFIHCANGVVVSPVGSSVVSDLYFYNVEADSSGNNGWSFVTAGTATIIRVSMVNCWGSSSTNSGMITQGIGGMIDSMFINNSQFVNNGLEGVHFQLGIANASVIGGLVSGNSQQGVHAAYGFRIGANVNGITANGVRIGPSQSFSDRELAQIGVDAGTGNRIRIIGCDLTTANTPISMSATGTNNVIEGCTGFFESGFISTTTDSTGAVVVTHGSGTTPKSCIANVSNTGAAVFSQPNMAGANGANVSIKFFNSSGAALVSAAIAFSWRMGW